MMDEDDYWNTSDNKAYSFEDVDIQRPSSLRLTNKLIEDSVSEASYDIPQIDLSLDTIISYHDLQLILDEQSSNEFHIPKNLTAEEELKLLRRQVYNRHSTQSIEKTISNLLLGQSAMASLEQYKSMKEKELLLDLAIDSANGDAILKVVLFLEATIAPNLFYQLLRTHPVAVHHFKNYLFQRDQIQKCADLLTMLGMYNEASIVQFCAAVNNFGNNVQAKQLRMKAIYNEYFSQPGTSALLSEMVANYLNLMNWQADEGKSQKTSSEPLLGESVLRSLFHCSKMYNWNDSNQSVVTSMNSPHAFAKQYQILGSQFDWLVLTERGKSQGWCDLETVFEKKSFLKTTSFQMNIPLEKALYRLHQLNAPQATLHNFLNRVPDVNKRLALAKSVNCSKCIIDCYHALKARPELIAFKDSLPKGSPEKFYADKKLGGL